MGSEKFFEAVVKEFAKIYGKPSCTGLVVKAYQNLDPKEPEENKALLQKIATMLS